MKKLFVIGLVLLSSFISLGQTYQIKDSEGYGILDLKVIAGLDFGMGADIYVNDEFLGKVEDEEIKIEGLLKGNNILKIDGERIKVFNEEFEFINDFEVKKDELILNEAERDIYISSNPQGAKILINESNTKKTTSSTITVGMDMVNISLDKDCYNIYSIDLNIPKKGEVIDLELNLDRNKPPSAPMIISPKNNEEVYYILDLQWENSTDNENSEINYEIWIGENKEELELIESTYDTSGRIELDKDKQYFWKVVAVDDRNNRTESAIKFFLTQPNLKPFLEKESGQEGKINISTQKFKWKAYDEDGGIVRYEYSKDGCDWEEILETSFKWEITEYVTHTFEVRAEDNNGDFSDPIIWNFEYEKIPIKENMVRVEGGTFQMESTNEDDYEKSIHQVTLDYNFIIGKYEVTFDEYDAYCDKIGKSKPKDEGWGRGQRPVIYVCWYDAIRYCNWLSESENLPVAYDGNGKFLDASGDITYDITEVVGYRLPTEAEWEFSARGRTNVPDYTYAGSNIIGDVAWYYDNSGRTTHEVGLKASNTIGTFDMSGNVWEWCNNRYDDYSNTEELNSVGPSIGSYCVLCGGSWYSVALRCSVVNRGNNSPTVSSNRIGFRICRTE